ERLTHIAERLGQPMLRWIARWVLAVEATRRGDIEEAEGAAEDALAIGTAAEQPDTLVFYGTQIAYVRWLQGRRAELLPLLAPVVEEMKGIPALPPLLAACQLDAWLVEEARRLMTVALPQLPPTPP